MSRREFSKVTKREALARSNGFCEGTGTFYGFPAGKRCNMPLTKGVEFDHVILDANSHDNSLTNCAAVCIPCHEWKTRHRDIPTAAKTVRQRDKNDGIRTRSHPMPGSKDSGWRKPMNGPAVRRS